MKQYLIFVLLFVFALPIYSQIDSLNAKKPTIGKLSSVVDIQDLTKDGFNYWQDEFTGHWAGIAIGINGMGKANYDMYPENENEFLENKLFASHSLLLNLFQYSASLQKNRNTIGIVTGIGLGIKAYRLNNNTSIEEGSGGIVQAKELYFDANQKSKLSSVYVNIPLLLEAQIPIRHYANRLYISGGITLSKRISSHTKIKYRKDNKKQKLKSPDDYSIRDYKYAAMLRIGYRGINLFATYDIVSMFENNKGPEIYPYTIGICLLSF